MAAKSLVSGLEGLEPQPKRRKSAPPTTAEARVERIIKETFGSMTRQQTDARTVHGLTLRARLFAALSTMEEKGGQRISSSTYGQLREMYADEGSMATRLTVTNKAVEASPALRQALATSRTTNMTKRSREPLYSFFSTTETLNQMEYVGILRSVCDLNPVTSPSARAHLLEVLKFTVNTDLDKKFPAETEIVKDLWDETLAQTFIAMKKERMPAAAWWETFEKYTRVLGYEDDFQTLTASTS